MSMPCWSLQAWPLAVLAVALVAAAVTDVRGGRIYNIVTYPAIVVGLIGHTLFGGLGGGSESIGLVGSLAGMAVGFLPMFIVWRAGGIGGGDAKLMAAVGALAGWRFALAGMFYGFAVAAVMALAVMIRRGIVRQTLARLWRVLFLIFTPTRPADPATVDSPKIPFGLALCIGCALAELEIILGRGVWQLLPGI